MGKKMSISEIDTKIRSVKRRIDYAKRHAAKLAKLAELRAELRTLRTQPTMSDEVICTATWGEGCRCRICADER
jgi:ribosomal protein L29